MDDDGAFDVVLPPGGIILEQVLAVGDKRRRGVTSTARSTAWHGTVEFQRQARVDGYVQDGVVVWCHGGVNSRPGKGDVSVPALEMDRW